MEDLGVDTTLQQLLQQRSTAMKLAEPTSESLATISLEGLPSPQGVLSSSLMKQHIHIF